MIKTSVPFLHLDTRNVHKDAWRELVKDHPAHFEILEWSPEQDKDLVRRSFPEVDIQLYPLYCLSILASFQKLLCYGGIAVRGEDVVPIRGLRILLNDWKTLGPPQKFTVRGRSCVDKTTIMTAQPNDPVCKLYLDMILQNLASRGWQHPTFRDDVAIM